METDEVIVCSEEEPMESENNNPAFIDEEESDDLFLGSSYKNPVSGSGGAVTYDCVWFGNYWQTDNDSTTYQMMIDDKKIGGAEVTDYNYTEITITKEQRILDKNAKSSVTKKNSIYSFIFDKKTGTLYQMQCIYSEM